MMKIEIDLNDILGDEHGAETLQDSVRRQVIDKMQSVIKAGVGKQIDEAVSLMIDENLKSFVKDKLPELIDNLFEQAYTPTGRYGDKEKPTTLRQELLKTIVEQFKYEKKNSYNSEKENIFTKAIDDCVKEHTEHFRKEFVSHVDGKFIAEAMDFATKRLAERLKVA